MIKEMFTRITELVSLLSDYENDYSVKEIAEMTDTSVAQTISDMNALAKYWPEAVSFDNKDKSYLLDPDVLDDDAVSPTLIAGGKHVSELFARNKLPDVFIKDTPLSSSIPDRLNDILRVIEKAIDGEMQISFRYRDRYGHIQNVTITPHYIYHNTFDNYIYVVSFARSDKIVVYRLDRILFGVRVLGKPDKQVVPDPNMIRKLECVWGAAFEMDKEPVPIEIWIKTDANNVLNKIMADTSKRECASIELNAMPGWHVYTDKIIGLSSFRVWLLMFGSSVKVIKPKELTDYIRSSSELRLLNYEMDRFTKPFSPQQ